MKMVKQKKWIILIWIIIILFTVVGSLLLPGLFLRRNANHLSKQLHDVPSEYYLGSGSAISQIASMQLSEYEKIRLMCGAWDSNTRVIASDQNEHNNTVIVKQVKEQLQYLYKHNLYPTSFSSVGANWYTWKIDCYCSTDSTFHTYSAYYFIVTLTKFDNSERHTVMITQDGTIVYAEALVPSYGVHIVDFAFDCRNLPIVNKKLCSYIKVSNHTLLPSYPEVVFPNQKKWVGVLTVGSEWITDTDTLNKYYHLFSDTLEFYYLFQSEEYSAGKTKYTLGIIPYEAPDKMD